MCKNEDTKVQEVKFIPLFIKLAGVILIAWFLFPLLLLAAESIGFVEYIKPSGENGAFGLMGDSFGSLNALFSGLALAGVIVAIILQSKEQRIEFQDNRKELKRAADAQENTIEVLKTTAWTNAIVAQLNALAEEIKKRIELINAIELSNAPDKRTRRAPLDQEKGKMEEDQKKAWAMLSMVMNQNMPDFNFNQVKKEQL
jgi:hypothetical protein